LNSEEVFDKIQEAGIDRVELAKHVFDRARKRNVDPSELKVKILEGDFESVRENNQSDPLFDESYRVKIESNGCVVEVPIYFNVPGTKILVKSIWRG